MAMIILIVLSLLFFLGGVLLKRRRKVPLPPGSMGWPYVGETFQLYSRNPNSFFGAREKKYGPIFKTHILGSPCVMMSTAEAAKFVLVTRSHLFKPTFPASKERMIGKQAIFFQHGDYHAKLRKLVLRSLAPESVKRHLSSIDSIASAFLRSLQSRGSARINTFHEMKAYALDVALLAIFGAEKVSCMEELKRCYRILEKGYNSMPINLPGTPFHEAMMARKQLADMLAVIISCKRRRRTEEGDLLSALMAETEALSDEQIADNIIGVIFASRDTTASVLTWIVKFLADHPAVLAAVTEEQQDVARLRRREKGERRDEGALRWDDIKSMAMSARVIQETMRLASVLSFTFREAVEDVNLNGYLIPKGWKVMPLFRNIHHSPHNFTDPHKFDPSRFQVTPKPNTYIPFGSGIHRCPGNELAKVEIMALLHHLTTKCRWELLAPHDRIHYAPFAVPCDGLPIKIHLKDCQTEFLFQSST